MFGWIEKQLLMHLAKRQEAGPVDRGWYALGDVAAKEAAEINAMFQALKVRAVVDAKRVIASPTGGFIRYPLKTYGKIAEVNSVRADIEMTVSMFRGVETSVKIRKPMLSLELPYPLETRILTWKAAQKRLQALQPFQALVGMNYNDDHPKPAIVDFSSKLIASGLIGGASGSGKTTLISNMIVSLCHATSPRDLQIIFCDAKYDEDYVALAALPHVTIVNSPADCATAIASVRAELERRKQAPSHSKVILFVDEYAELKGLQDDGGEALDRHMASIAAVGRSKNIHLMLSTQKPTVEIVDTVAKANLTVRLGGMVMTKEESRVVMGAGDVGCELLDGGGSFYARLGRGRVIRIQSYFLDGEILETAVDAVAQKWGGVEPLRIAMDADVTFVTPQQPTPTEDIDAAMIERVKLYIDHDEIFDADGAVVRGMRAKLLRLLYDEDTADKGTPGRTLDRILERLQAEPWPVAGGSE